jgi:NAD(P)H-quinone oxidoreductase subunit 5
MLVLVSFVGWVVVRYRGDLHGWGGRTGQFTGWLCATLAA